MSTTPEPQNESPSSPQTTQVCCNVGWRGATQPLLFLFALGGLAYAGTNAWQRQDEWKTALTGQHLASSQCSLNSGCPSSGGSCCPTQTVDLTAFQGCCSQAYDQVASEEPASALLPENAFATEGTTL